MILEVVRAEAKAAQLLSQMPGRLCTNGATKSCSLHTRQGCKGVNQDCMLAWEGFSAEEGSVFCGVFDGHGPNGHVVASKVRDCLPSLLTVPLECLLEGVISTPLHHISESIKIIDNKDHQPGAPAGTEGSKSEDDDEGHEDTAWIKKRFTTAFHKMDERLRTHPKLRRCMTSGTTAVAMLVQGDDLVVGNVGDSRAILVSRHQDGSLIAEQLTRDLKPDSPGERERIKECQGRVFALEDEPHTARLWLPNSDAPGLAMARAFGDFCLKDHGLIATPEMSHRKVTKDDEFIVLATDGVWDVLSNKSVLDIIASCRSKEDAAKSVVDAAMRAWKLRNQAYRMDDCAVVCYFLKGKLSTPSSAPGSRPSHKLKAEEFDLEMDPGDTVQGDDASENSSTNSYLPRYNTIVDVDTLDRQELGLEPSLQAEKAV